ncbi:hypothetical protein PYCCODRAFT_381990 [Trametes coccinea BRFM310]|uniref:Uncharacterized protein n=1 Tax=Trametes coccinea (strain BRFM310) TaxID=1353009 RepID=A0A1Y2J3R6_TRAC3|nr:hypothetical protein PYCCODRAFT_381990 [Trametes coccinea BRFM310]
MLTRRSQYDDAGEPRIWCGAVVVYEIRMDDCARSLADRRALMCRVAEQSFCKYLRQERDEVALSCMMTSREFWRDLRQRCGSENDEALLDRADRVGPLSWMGRALVQWSESRLRRDAAGRPWREGRLGHLPISGRRCRASVICETLRALFDFSVYARGRGR